MVLCLLFILITFKEFLFPLSWKKSQNPKIYFLRDCPIVTLLISCLKSKLTDFVFCLGCNDCCKIDLHWKYDDLMMGRLRRHLAVPHVLSGVNWKTIQFSTSLNLNARCELCHYKMRSLSLCSSYAMKQFQSFVIIVTCASGQELNAEKNQFSFNCCWCLNKLFLPMIKIALKISFLIKSKRFVTLCINALKGRLSTCWRRRVLIKRLWKIY